MPDVLDAIIEVTTTLPADSVVNVHFVAATHDLSTQVVKYIEGVFGYAPDLGLTYSGGPGANAGYSHELFNNRRVGYSSPAGLSLPDIGFGLGYPFDYSRLENPQIELDAFGKTILLREQGQVVRGIQLRADPETGVLLGKTDNALFMLSLGPPLVQHKVNF
ncbi:hypothetical protein BZM27_40465 [Paraburkholderia steynii]|jgi:hypothetical protein|uniref:Uncharacterized protein n=1 Tax=Paraburkholderia steynii TaxID=1245441 RepID=A0A4R0X3Q3_9BURK|nr:hypothetical protein BZM27_40465 [Paraburkholderia steynii]